jgi:predicted ATP-grasp superfamily ATP-dependent carboligase
MRTRSTCAHGRQQLDVLVLDAGQRQSLVAIRSLSRAGLRVGAFDSHRDIPAFFSRHTHVAGVLSDYSVGIEQFFARLEHLIERHEPKCILASHDGTIEVLRRRRAEMEKHAALALPPEPALETAVDKAKTLALARSVGVPTPKGMTVDDADDVQEALSTTGLPAVVKPTRSWVGAEAGATRLVAGIATSEAEAVALASELRSHGSEVLVQEWVPGVREAVIVFRDGEVATYFALRVQRTSPPLGGASVVRESISPLPELVEPAARLVAAAGLLGVCEVEFRRDARGTPVLMEINPRLPATVELGVRAGIDFPLLEYEWARGRSVCHSGSYRTCVRLRWLGGDLAWLWETMRSQGRPEVMPSRRAAATFVGAFFKPSSYDYVELSDMMPAAAAAISFARRAASRALRSGVPRRSDRGEARRSWPRDPADRAPWC